VKREISKAGIYRKGRRFEYEVKKRLEAQGFLVFRTAGSHGAADLICVPEPDHNAVPRPRLIRFIQCKAGKPTAADWRKLKAMKAKFGHSWAMATKEGITDV